MNKIIQIYYALYRFFNYRFDTMPRYYLNCLQRRKSGWGYQDIWNLDRYTAHLLWTSVMHLRKIKHGIPIQLVEKYKLPNAENYEYDEEKAEEEWKLILYKIARTFYYAEQIITNDWILHNHMYSEAKYKRLVKKFRKLKHIFVMTPKMIRQYREGWTLFQKYFYNLWD